eukprot:GHVU01065978.1.p1 GENE.GHVU01065978.1~~GHVU01065978.1.p1  ORF type:complete len:239 (+),score=21.70 GHVU01065978.1:569-1285(+)
MVRRRESGIVDATAPGSGAKFSRSAALDHRTVPRRYVTARTALLPAILSAFATVPRCVCVCVWRVCCVCVCTGPAPRLSLAQSMDALYQPAPADTAAQLDPLYDEGADGDPPPLPLPVGPQGHGPPAVAVGGDRPPPEAGMPVVPASGVAPGPAANSSANSRKRKQREFSNEMAAQCLMAPCIGPDGRTEAVTCVLCEFEGNATKRYKKLVYSSFKDHQNSAHKYLRDDSPHWCKYSR